MGIQRWLKLPFRIARGVYRGVRDELRPPAEAAPSVAAPVQPTPPTPPVAAAPPPAPAPPPERPPVQVRIEETPNPDARKFVCSATVVRDGSMAFNDADNARGIAFADAIFRLEGVRTIFATKDFVTVTRRTEAPPWTVLEPAIVEALRTTVGR